MKSLKKVVVFMLTLAMVLGVAPFTKVETKAEEDAKVKVVAFDNRQVGWSDVCAYVWDNNGVSAVYEATSMENGYYIFKIGSQYENILFKTGYDKTTWNMQTSDLKIPANGDYCFQPFNGFYKTNGRWYCPSDINVNTNDDLAIELNNDYVCKGYTYLSAKAVNGKAPYTFEVEYTDINGNTYYSTSLTNGIYGNTYALYNSGDYKFSYKVTDSEGKVATANRTVTIEPLTFESVTPSKNSVRVGETVEFTPKTVNAWLYKAPKRVFWTIEKNGKKFVDNEITYSDDAFSWVPTEEGVYQVSAEVRDSSVEVAYYNFEYTVKSATASNLVKVYYNNSNWNTAYIHYAVNGSNWTNGCGVKMMPSDDYRYTYMYVIDLGKADGAQVCFNNGNGSWDSQNARNYRVNSGTYAVVYGNVYYLSDVVNN